MQISKDAGRLVACLEGELDHHTAADIRERLEAALTPEVKLLVLDLQPLGFMDSSGIGVVLGRYRQMQERGGQMQIQCNGRVAQILELAGVFDIIQRVEAIL